MPFLGIGIAFPLVLRADGCTAGLVGLPTCGAFPGTDELWMGALGVLVFAVHLVATVWHRRPALGPAGVAPVSLDAVADWLDRLRDDE